MTQRRNGINKAPTPTPPALANNNDEPPAKLDLTPELIERLLENQTLQLQIDAQELKLREKEIDANQKIAEATLHHQADILKNKPTEARKTLTRGFYVLSGLLVIVFCFFGFCLYSGNEKFAMTILEISSHFFTVALGFYFGRRVERGKKNNLDPIEEIELVNT